MKKVLMIASNVSHFKNFHMPYIEYLNSVGVQVHTAANGAFDAKSVAGHIELSFRKKLFHPANIGVILRLARIMRKESYDAVYTNSTLAGFAGRCALRLSGRKSTLAVHICHGYLFSDDKSLRSKLYLAFEKSMRRRTDVLAVMNGEDREIARKYSLGKEIVFINGMGLDSRRFPLISEDELKAARSQAGAGENDVIFLCAGEFSSRKNQKTVIKACSELKRSDYRMIFAGDGELLEECVSYAKELGVYGKMQFMGHYTDMNRLYRLCDCVVSASRFEGLPFNVMEALYCGANIAVSDVKGNNDLAKETGGGLYAFGDASALAALMESAAKNSAHECALDSKYLLDTLFEENIDLLKMRI